MNRSPNGFLRSAHDRPAFELNHVFMTRGACQLAELGHLFWPILLFLGFLVSVLLRALRAGGDRHTSIVEITVSFHIVICYVLATRTTRSLGDVGRLATVA